MTVAHVTVDFCSEDDALAAIASRLARAGGRPLVVGSVNLDHLHHFGRGRAYPDCADLGPGLEWLMLADGAPIVLRARLLTGRRWPRVTGADLLPRVLSLAGAERRAIGFLGGLPEVHDRLRRVIDSSYPDVRVSGLWSPDRDVLTDPGRSADVASAICAAGTEILVVGLGKPLQENWIARHGISTGAPVMLAFGASADFLAGSSKRAPEWMQRSGLEWSYRLGREPRRMARRYLVQGPRSLLRLRRAEIVGAPGRVADAHGS